MSCVGRDRVRVRGQPLCTAGPPRVRHCLRRPHRLQPEGRQAAPPHRRRLPLRHPEDAPRHLRRSQDCRLNHVHITNDGKLCC